MKNIMMVKLFSLLLLSSLGTTTFAQSKSYTPVSQELYDTIIKKDSILFEAANSGNIDKLKTFFTEDLEFFHDAGGLANYKETVDNFTRVATNYAYTRRVLVPKSVEVYPIKDYGAVQTGLHQFCRLEKGSLINCGTFKFVHIWKQTSEGWKISRVVSYGH